jgi:hypothetical protein
MVKIIEFILGDFLLFEVNSVNGSVDFSVDLVFFGFCNRDVGSESFDLDLEFSVLSS